MHWVQVPRKRECDEVVAAVVVEVVAAAAVVDVKVVKVDHR